jgi:ABC-type branched-subunit amino acid transport system substrate-binding protein
MNARVVARRARGMGVLLASGAALFAAGCGSDDDAASAGGSGSGEKGEIVVGATGPLTGPASSLAVLYDAMRAKFAQINADGGIDGNKLRLEVQDDQLNPANTPGVMRKLIEGENATMICGSAGSPTNVAVQPYLQARKVAVVPGAGSSDLAAENSYLPSPTYEPLAASLVRYAIDEAGKQKIAIAYSDDAVGKPTRAGAKWQLEQMGHEPVAEVKYNPTATDQSSVAAKLKASGADFVVVNNTAPVLAPIIKASEKVGFRPTYGVMWPALTKPLIDLVGEATAERLVFASPFLLGADEAANEFRDALKKEAPKADTDDTIAMLGWVTATTCAELLKKAVEEAGGGVPSREQVLNAMPGFTYSDEYVKNIEWTEEDHSTKGDSSIVGIKDGKFVALTDFEPLPDAPIAGAE